MSALFGFSGAPDPALVERMGATLTHRGAGRHPTVGPDGTAVFQGADQGGVAISADGQVRLVVAGLVLSPPAEGRPIADVLLEAYLGRGTDGLESVRGGFIVAVWDRDTLHLVRDGAGARTVYYGRHDGRLFFGIEPKAVLAGGLPRRIRPAAVAQYLSFSFVPGAGTMLEGLFELPAGHRLTVAGAAEPVLHRWFRFEESEEDGDVTDGQWVERFHALHADAIRQRMPANDPVAVFLSGGIDSSIVVAELAAQGVKPLPTFAIHFGPQYANELEFARAVADRCGADHEEVLVSPDGFVERLRKVIWHLDDPIGDPITVPNFELARHVSKHARWVFNGEGGDPCFGGPKNLTMMLHHWYGGVAREPRFRERRYLSSYRRAYAELAHLLTDDVRDQFDEQADLEAVLTPFFEAERPRSFLNKLMAINIRLKGAHLILPKVERMLGAFGVTPLSPLFDERIIEASFAMPGRLKVHGGVEKIALKRAYADALPPSVIQRPKSGMRVPVHFWFKDELRDYAKSILNPTDLRRVGIFKEDRVQQLLDYDIAEGQGRYGLRLWMLLTFEIWRRIVVEGEPV